MKTKLLALLPLLGAGLAVVPASPASAGTCTLQICGRVTNLSYSDKWVDYTTAWRSSKTKVAAGASDAPTLAGTIFPGGTQGGWSDSCGPNNATRPCDVDGFYVPYYCTAWEKAYYDQDTGWRYYTYPGGYWYKIQDTKHAQLDVRC